jgi:hypothetical protein
MEDKEYVPGDVIAAIFYFMHDDFFTGRRNVIHETIFEARTSFPILQAFPFSKEDVSHFSRTLEDALHRLELSRVIGMENPDFTRFMIKKGAKDYLRERIIPLFNEEEKKQLSEIAKVFSQKCNA